MSVISEIAKRHGVNPATVKSTYNVWDNIKQRCHNPNHVRYHNYGGRGVIVCQRWRDSFLDFVADMGLRPSVAHSIDRIDNDKGYSPENCRWATEAEQQRNRTNNRVVEYQGETLCVSDLARRFGLTPGTLRFRLDRGMSVEDAVSKPVQKRRTHRDAVRIEYNGESYTVPELARQCGLPTKTLRNRLKSGWSLRRALLSPSGFPPPHRLLRVEPIL